MRRFAWQEQVYDLVRRGGWPRKTLDVLFVGLNDACSSGQGDEALAMLNVDRLDAQTIVGALVCLRSWRSRLTGYNAFHQRCATRLRFLDPARAEEWLRYPGT